MLIVASLAAAAVMPLRLAADTLRAGDVASLATGRDAAILRLPPDVRAVTLEPDVLRTLVANRLPGVRFALRRRTALRLLRGPTARPAANCQITRVAVPAGSVVDAEMVARARCTGLPVRLAYNRALNAPVARDDIGLGANLGMVRVPPARPLGAGSGLTLRTRSGPVTIERSVVALQPVRAGARVFVRTPDGAVLAARVAAR